MRGGHVPARNICWVCARRAGYSFIMNGMTIMTCLHHYVDTTAANIEVEDNAATIEVEDIEVATVEVEGATVEGATVEDTTVEGATVEGEDTTEVEDIVEGATVEVEDITEVATIEVEDTTEVEDIVEVATIEVVVIANDIDTHSLGILAIGQRCTAVTNRGTICLHKPKYFIDETSRLCKLHYSRLVIDEETNNQVTLGDTCSICFTELGEPILDGILRGSITNTDWGIIQLACKHTYHMCCINKQVN